MIPSMILARASATAVRIAAPVGRRPVVAAVWSAGYPVLLPRMFCAAGPSQESRVIKAVARYAAMRREELENETDDTTGNKEKMLKSVSAETTWDDLGFDDLDRVEVLLEVEDEFGHIMPDKEADEILNVKMTVEYLEKQAL